MNSNQRLAIEWATQALNSREVVMADSFFAPFNTKQAQEVAKELLKKGLLALEYPQANGSAKGAFIVKRAQCRLLENAELNVSGWIFQGKNGNAIVAKAHKFVATV